MKASVLIKTEKMVLIFDGDEPVEERTLNLTVNPGALTPAKEAVIRDADEEDSGPLAVLMSELISEWDLEVDGKTVPLTVEALMNTPTLVLMLIMNEVGEAMQEKATEQGKISVAT